jgi:uncharacterized protein YfaS (alpha-2-macroglobulin family)
MNMDLDTDMDVRRMNFPRRCAVALLALVMTTASCVPYPPSPVPIPTAPPTAAPTTAPTQMPLATPIPSPSPTEPPAILSPLFAAGITSEPLGIVSTQPADKAQEVAVNRTSTRIIVQFNHPVVPLVSVAAQKTLPQPLKLTPAVAGDGEWLNTSTFAFVPSQDFRVATNYTVSVSPVKDMLGLELSGATWSFRTTSPAVARTYPEANTQFVATSLPISITFNTEMDRASTESRFSLTSGGVSVSGAVEWQGAVMRFTPARPLAYDTGYTAKLSAGALDASRAAGTAKDVTWTFRTVPQPGVVNTLPFDGDRNAKQQRNGFQITFASPMAAFDAEGGAGSAGITVTVQPTITNLRINWKYDSNNTVALVYGGWQASRAYTVTIDSQSRTRNGETLGRNTVVRFTAAPLDPQFNVNAPGVGQMGLYDTGVPQVIYASATNVDRLDYRLNRVSQDDLLRLLSGDSYTLWKTYQPPTGSLVRQWSLPTQAALNATALVSSTLSASPGGLLGAGVYFLEASAPGMSSVSRHLLLVSNVNLTLKHTTNEALVWATELATGHPVVGQPITLYDAAMSPIAQGQTDSEGIYRTKFTKPVDPWGNIAAFSLVDGMTVAAVATNWQDGISPWDYNIPSDRLGQDYYANLYTDRAIYRPAQSVFFKGVLRKDNDAEYTLPDVAGVNVQVRDSQYRLVYTQTASLDKFGAFDGEVILSQSATIGDYSIQMELNKRIYASTSFQVAEYRAPQFQVAVTADKPEYIIGDTIRVESTSSYFFGGPVGEATVTWRLMSNDYDFRPDTVNGWWDFNDWDYYSPRNGGPKVIRDGRGKTDAQGTYRFNVPADVNEFPLSQSFVLETEVTDINNESVASRTTVVVHKGRFYTGLRPQQYVGATGKEQFVDVITVDTKGLTVTNQTLGMSFYQRQWFSVREKQVDGGFTWRNSFTDTLISTATVTTGPSGAAVAKFTPTKGGTYRIVAEGTDAAGNKVRSATYQWVSDTSFVNWRMEDNDRVDLIADRKQYAPGETAEILIPAPFGQAEALLTIERGSIREVRRIFLTGNSERVRIPIKQDYAPNVFVSVVMVKGRSADSPQPQFKLGYVTLPVSAAEKQLTVKLTPERGRYTPGDKATFTVEASDFAGRPVQAEFSLALVDKAIQSLAADRSISSAQAFWGQRSLGVTTAASLNRSQERVNKAVASDTALGGKGGGGGLPDKPVRQDFRDTAYWNPAVLTDQTGRAQVSVTLPDNLTTWNMTAKGVTLATQVGEARVDILSTKDLLVRPVLPRFFVVGDKARLEAVVNNNTSTNVTVDVRLSATGLTLSGSAQQPLSVKANDKAKVTWDVTVGAVDQVVVTFSAGSGSLQDAIRQTLPVLRPTSAETVATAGQVETKIVEQVVIPLDADRSAGELRVSLSPSLAAASRDSLAYLESFEYECTEQAVSRFFPNAVTYLALKKLGIQREELRKNLEDNIARAAPRLYGLQNRDGGWGWWSGEASRPVLTAYALLALYTTRQAGFLVDSDVMTRAEQYLVADLNRSLDANNTSAYNERAFVVFVLSEMGRTAMVSRATTLYDQRARLDLYGKAFLLMALKKTGQSQAQAVLSELTSAAITSATGAHWEEKQPDFWGMNTNTRTTALAIMAIGRADPKNALLANAVRWLMVARKEGHWETTQVTAWSVLALTEFMASTGELSGSYTYQLTVNGKPIGDGSVDKSNVDQSRQLVVAIRDMLQTTSAEVAITRGPGDGKLYYSAYLNYFLPADKIAALNRGIVVGRQYFAVDGQTLKPSDRQVESASIGDYVQVRLTVVAPNDLHYMVLEDPLPAGFEAVDNTLLTSSAAIASPQLKPGAIDPAASQRPDRYFSPFWQYWAHTEIRDDRVAVFATYLGRGVYEYSYTIRAGLAGTFRALPARAWEMYFPETFGRSSGTVFTVK